ncbi:hypothetical protein GGR51DRAFT_497709 [Nemania sp. FL0031]|nr:hypothetical protein GGR51DRAFT_497709 [Nemania sp. FL0031]
MDQDHIDGLLERYLHLLHEYTSLREELTTLQTGMYQNIARANFAAERGLRFGQDHYDDRMQATRRLVISCRGQPQQPQGQDQDQQSENHQDRRDLIPNFTVMNPASASVSALTAEDSESPNPPSSPPHPEADAQAEADSESVEEDATKQAYTKVDTDNIDSQRQENDKSVIIEKTKAEKATSNPPAQKSKDPLRWFGLLTPVPLRQAQAQSIRAVEHVIPRLASVDAEMAQVEIEVRRARKRRAKAEAAASKLAQQATQEQRRGPGVEGVAAS